MKRLQILSILLTLCMALSLCMTACDKSGGDKDTSTAAETTPEPVESDTAAPATDPAAEQLTDPATQEVTEAPTEAPTVPSADKPDPVITLSSTDVITVKAGETAQLPTYTASDPSNGKDLTSWVEVSDSMEMDAVQGKSFCSKIAGEHTVYYFLETSDGRVGEAFLTVKVEGATASTFELGDCGSLDQMTDYKEFREDFEKGKKAPMMMDYNGSKAFYLSSTDEAIEGTSLIYDTNSGSLSGRFYGFSDYFHRDEQTTYRVTFSYKILEASNNFTDFYFGLVWDGTNGINRNFIPADAEIGKVYTVTVEFAATAVPSGVNAGFFMFKLNPASSPLRIAFDNFVIETIKLKQVVTDLPTVAEMMAEGGFTWDFHNKYATCENGVIVETADLPEDIRNEIASHPGFGDEVLKASNTEGHAFSGLNVENMPIDRTLTLDMDYYCVNDSRLYLILITNAGNKNQTVERTQDGNIVHLHMVSRLEDVCSSLQMYVQNNAAFEIYIGNVHVSME